MKKVYMQPIVREENAEPTNIICISIKGDSDTGLTGSGGSDGSAHTQEWDMWGDE